MRTKRKGLLALAGVIGFFFIAAIIATWSPRQVVKHTGPVASYNVAGPAASYDVAEPSVHAPDLMIVAPPSPTESARDAKAPGKLGAIAVSVPKLAYAYALGFRLPGERIAATQETHRLLCERMGETRCQLLALERSAADDVQAQATLKLRVASAEARKFGDALTRVVAQAGGRALQTSVTAADVSKEIVDTEARIRQRELLVARLTEILRARSGTVAELLEAERSIAAAQEELDQARGWLVELRSRVAMSNFEIGYAAIAAQATPRIAGDQLGEATQGSGAAFLIAMRTLLILLIYLAPWALLALPVAWFVRRRLSRRGSAIADDPDCTPAPLPV